MIKNVIADGFRVEMWASLPCKPWSSWNEFNAWKLGARFRRRLKLMRDESQIMIDNFILIASLVIEHGGDVSFEWPAFCEGFGK